MMLFLSLTVAWLVKNALVGQGLQVLGWTIFFAPLLFALVDVWYKKTIVVLSPLLLIYLEPRHGDTAAMVFAFSCLALLVVMRQLEARRWRKAERRAQQENAYRPLLANEATPEPTLEDVYYIPAPVKKRVLN
jgi:hypothetical protein